MATDNNQPPAMAEDAAIYWPRHDYRFACGILRLTPMPDPWSPAAVRAHLPPWLTPDQLVTEPGSEHLRAWVECGSQIPDARAIARRFRFVGSLWAHTLIRGYLATTKLMPPPVLWDVIEHTTTHTLGLDARGRCVLPPPPRIRRILEVIDSGDADETLSIFLHEAAHSWLMPGRPPAMSDLEDVVYNGPLAPVAAADAGYDIASQARTDLLAERQASILARQWGAVGDPADPHFAERTGSCASSVAAALRTTER